MFNLRIVLISFSILILCLTGCTGQNECETYVQDNAQREEGFTGYVVDRKDDLLILYLKI